VRALPKPTWRGVLGEDQWRSSDDSKPETIDSSPSIDHNIGGINQSEPEATE
jgi:hypothetical protein